MIKETRLTSTQIVLVMISQVMATYTSMPVLKDPPANQDVWIVEILSTVLSVVISIPAFMIIRRFRGKTDFEASLVMLGGVMGRVFPTIFALFAALGFGLGVLMDVVFITTTLFPETPVWALLLYMLLPIGYMAYKGIGTIARSAVFIGPYIILTVLLFLLLGIKDMELSNLKPVLADSSLSDIARGALIEATTKSELFFLFVYNVFLDKSARLGRIFAVEVSLNLVIIMMMVVPTLCLLGPDVARLAAYPYYLYTGQVEAYDFIQRVESLNLLAWFLGSLLRAALYCFTASYVFANVVRVRNKGAFVPAICLLVFILIMIPSVGNAQVLKTLSTYPVWPALMIFVLFVMSIIMLFVYFIRKRLGLLGEPQEEER